jgi:hypothetical protein
MTVDAPQTFQLGPYYHVTDLAIWMQQDYKSVLRAFQSEGVCEMFGGRLVVWTNNMREKMPHLYTWLYENRLAASRDGTSEPSPLNPPSPSDTTQAAP